MVAQISDTNGVVSANSQKLDFDGMVLQSKTKNPSFVQSNDLKVTRPNLLAPNNDSALDGALGAADAGIDNLKDVAKSAGVLTGNFFHKPWLVGETIEKTGGLIKDSAIDVKNYVADMVATTSDPLKFSTDIEAFKLGMVGSAVSASIDGYENYKIAAENSSGQAYIGAKTVDVASESALSLLLFAKPIKAVSTVVKKMDGANDGVNNVKGSPSAPRSNITEQTNNATVVDGKKRYSSINIEEFTNLSKKQIEDEIGTIKLGIFEQKLEIKTLEKNIAIFERNKEKWPTDILAKGDLKKEKAKLVKEKSGLENLENALGELNDIKNIDVSTKLTSTNVSVNKFNGNGKNASGQTTDE